MVLYLLKLILWRICVGSYLCMEQVDIEGIQCGFLLWCDDLHIEYTHELCYHSTFEDVSQTL